jgi:hypothetical protein
MRRLSPDASSPWSVGRSDERCERNVHSTYFHTKPSVSERLYGLRYHLRPLFHLYITHISQSHDPRNRLPQGSDRATRPETLVFGLRLGCCTVSTRCRCITRPFLGAGHIAPFCRAVGASAVSTVSSRVVSPALCALTSVSRARARSRCAQRKPRPTPRPT